MPSEQHSNVRLPQPNPNNPPPYENVVPLGVLMAIRAEVIRRLAHRVRARQVFSHIQYDNFLTIEEETLEPLPLYTKVPSADEMTAEISTSEKPPDYHDAVPTDDVAAGRKRKRKERDVGRSRRSVKRRIIGRTEIIVERAVCTNSDIPWIGLLARLCLDDPST